MMKTNLLRLILCGAIFINLDAFARTVFIENQSPYIFSIYTDSSIKDVLNIYNFQYEHITENDTDGSKIEFDVSAEQPISFYLRQLNKSGEQIVTEAEAVAAGGIKAYGFYNLLSGLKKTIKSDSYFYPFVEKYFPCISIVTTAFLFGYEIINRSLSLPGIFYEEIPANMHSYKLRIKEHEGGVFLEKLRIKEKQD